MTRLALCFAVSIGLLVPPALAHAKCARVAWSPALITKPDKPVPANGGILVGAVRRGRQYNRNNQDPSITNWSLRRKSGRVTFRHQRIAPGLTQYIPSRRIRGAWQLAGTRTKPMLRFARATRVSMTAPRVRSVVWTQTLRRGKFRGRRRSVHVRANLRGRIPAGAVGVVVYRKRRKLLKAMLFHRVKARALGTVALYDSPGRCQSDVPGMTVPRDGTRVQLRWVDAFGRLSPLSRPIVVRKR